MINLNKVKGLRAEFGYTQKEVAKMLEISEISYNHKEKGKNEFTGNELAKMCIIYQVNPSVFFTDKV